MFCSYNSQKVALEIQKNIWKSLDSHGRSAVPTTKKSKQRGTPVKFFKDKIQYTWGLEAKSEFNLGFGSTHRSFWTMTQLWGFKTRKFDSSTKPSSGRALEAPRDQTNIGMTCCDIKVTFENIKLGETRFALGWYSLVMLAKHVKDVVLARSVYVH